LQQEGGVFEKARVALETLRGDRRLTELGEHFGVHPNQIQPWKNRPESQAATIFEKGNGAGKEPWVEIKEVHAKIGHVRMERDLLLQKLAR